MNFPISLKLFILISLTFTAAQQRPDCPRCPQEACPKRCQGDRNIGVRCAAALPRIMWYYHPISRTCRPMDHLGCGGNANRWCSKEDCEGRCVVTWG